MFYSTLSKSHQIHTTPLSHYMFPLGLAPSCRRQSWDNWAQNWTDRAPLGPVHTQLFIQMCFLIRGHTMPGPRPDTLGRHGPKPSTTGLPDHQTVPTQAIFTPTCDVTKLRPPDDLAKRRHPCTAKLHRRRTIFFQVGSLKPPQLCHEATLN